MNEPVRPKPAWLDDIKHCVSLVALSKDSPLQNPKLQIGVIPGLEGIVEIMLETSVNVPFPNTPYEIIVSATRGWPGTNTSITSDPVCTVSMRGIDWDGSMTSAREWKQDSWEPELDKILSNGEPSFRDGFTSFIQSAIRLQTILDEMTPMSTSSPVNGKRLADKT